MILDFKGHRRSLPKSRTYRLHRRLYCPSYLGRGRYYLTQALRICEGDVGKCTDISPCLTSPPSSLMCWVILLWASETVPNVPCFALLLLLLLLCAWDKLYVYHGTRASVPCETEKLVTASSLALFALGYSRVHILISLLTISHVSRSSLTGLSRLLPAVMCSAIDR